MNIVTLSRVLAGTTVAGLVLAGCGGSAETASTGAGSSGDSSAVQTAHNDTDVAFAQDMVVHHQQAVEMADVAADRSQNPQVLDLAARISTAQGPEIDTLNDWLQEWGATTSSGGMTGMDHSGMTGMDGTGGMMSAEDMTALEQMSGTAFDAMFLEMMAEHHRGAVDMAETEIVKGSDPRATALAQIIIDAQQAEIAEIEQLLTRL